MKLLAECWREQMSRAGLLLSNFCLSSPLSYWKIIVIHEMYFQAMLILFIALNHWSAPSSKFGAPKERLPELLVIWVGIDKLRQAIWTRELLLFKMIFCVHGMPDFCLWKNQSEVTSSVLSFRKLGHLVSLSRCSLSMAFMICLKQKATNEIMSHHGIPIHW